MNMYIQANKHENTYTSIYPCIAVNKNTNIHLFTQAHSHKNIQLPQDTTTQTQIDTHTQKNECHRESCTQRNKH